MVNPFDQNFFKFFIGFIFILSASFGILYIVGIYSQHSTDQAATMGK